MKVFGVSGWDGQWVYCQHRSGKVPWSGAPIVKRLKIFVLEVFTSASRTRFSSAGSGNVYGLVTEVKAEVAREGCGTSERLQSVAG
jgi:hypothetical protein